MISIDLKLKTPARLSAFIDTLPDTLSRALNDALFDTRDKLIAATFPQIEVASGRGRRSPGTRRKESGRAVLRVERANEFDLSGKIYLDLSDPKDQVAVAHLVTAKDWIHAFVHSNAAVFIGKTKDQRIRMALGAYYRRLRTSQFKQAAAKLDPSLYEQRFNDLMLAQSLRTFPYRAKQAIKSI
jgi:hypothetical protein